MNVMGDMTVSALLDGKRRKTKVEMEVMAVFEQEDDSDFHPRDV
jgi:hypothetical protein